MESESSGDNMNSNSWSSATSWTIASGNLVDSLTFESSTSAIDDDDDGDDKSNNLDSTTKTPLVLQPPVPDSAPCEITLNFTQKHEVQQIYVRSTARVYEIYYVPDFQSGNEYLCTVRCGIAARNEQVLHTTDNEDSLSACSKGSENNLSKESSRSDSNLSTSEDDWVEVKVPNASVLGNKENSSPLKFCSAQERSTQDFYEATAQITDANPCVSLTLRLLSLQSKERVYVDEIYVFADPVDSSDSENQVVQVENSAGRSLMTMLLPTLLQLSKTKGATQSQDKQTSDAWKKQNLQSVRLEATDSTTIASKVQQQEKPYVSDSTTITAKVQQEEKPSISGHQEVEFQDFNKASVGTAQLQNPSQVPLSQSDFPPNNHVERSLDQLFSQMGRIEGICLRLEENLLKPINSIEARLQRVEQQLEVLTNKPKNSGFSSCSRFCAPNFSCIESDSTSFCNSGGDYPHCEEFESNEKEGDNEEFESNKKDIHSDTLSTPADDMSDSVKATDWLPSLVITAPEFSNCDDEEENNASNGVMDSLVDKPRQALTIDDALASALAGFVSSVSMQSENYAQSLSVETLEVSNEEDGIVGKRASLKVQCEISTDGTESTDDSPPSRALNLSSLESEGIEVTCLNLENSDKIAGVHGQYLPYEGGDIDEPWGSHVNNNDDQIQSHRDIVGTEETENEEVSSEIRNITVPDETYIQSQILINQTDADSNTIQEDVTASTDSTAAAEVTEEGSDRDILRNMFEFSQAASVVDFEVPVLDVKFVSQDSCTGYIPLEALLSDLPKSKSESSGEESVDVSPSGEHGSLIFVEDGESVGPAAINNFSVDLDYCSLQEPLSMEDETVVGLSRNICSSHELSTVQPIDTLDLTESDSSLTRDLSFQETCSLTGHCCALSTLSMSHL